jgi:hypothetical protein
VHHPAADHRGDRGDVPDLVGGDGEVVAVEDQQVGEQARPDRAEVVLPEHQLGVAPRVRDEGLVPGERLVEGPLPAKGPAGHRPPQRDERVDLGRAGPVGAQAPAQPAVADQPQRGGRGPGGTDDALAAELDGDAEPSRPLQVRGGDPLGVRHRPAQRADRVLPVHPLVGVEDQVKSPGGDRVGLDRPAAARRRPEDLAGGRDVVAGRAGRAGRVVPVEGRVVDLPHRDPVVPVIAVEGPGPPDPLG